MNIAILVAGGKGKRMQNRVNKLFLLLNKEPIMLHTARVFNESKSIDSIILVVNPDDREKFRSLVKSEGLKKIKQIVHGGLERQDSSYAGFCAIKNAKDDDIVLIHNAANPFVDEALIKDMLKHAQKFGAACAGFPAKDTIKVVQDGFVKQTIDRSMIWLAQTPQAMKYFLLKRAFMHAKREGFYGTDEATLIEKIGGSVKMVQCNRENIKITEPYDLVYANKLVSAQAIGIGQDSHAFTDQKKPLIIAGIKIRDSGGFEANSDGDVVLHALFNAISTALGMKSLGFYADAMFREGIVDSKRYLPVVLEKMGQRNLMLQNIAIMLEGKEPKIDAHIPEMKLSLGKLLGLDSDSIGIAATSGEGLTDFGKGKGMQCFVAVTLRKKMVKKTK